MYTYVVVCVCVASMHVSCIYMIACKHTDGYTCQAVQCFAPSANLRVMTVSVYVCMYLCMHVCMCVCMYVFVCVCVYVFMYQGCAPSENDQGAMVSVHVFARDEAET